MAGGAHASPIPFADIVTTTEFETVGDLIAQLLHALRAEGADNAVAEQAVLARVQRITARFPMYA